MKKIVAINAGPRKGYNTDTLVRKAADGAAAAGAEIIWFDLYRLEKFTGCISCFACKLEPNLGRCAVRDGLKPVLDAIREADGLIIGTPNYLGDVTAMFRALFERLIFQSLTYRRVVRNRNEHLIPVLMIMTSNASEEYYAQAGYDAMLERYRGSLNTFVGPTEIMTCTDTLQVKDYSRYNWTMFDPEHKKKRHDEVFPLDCEKAYRLGSELLK
ncbi:MAG: flavodoxin family protein [Solobacterium sp.]|nr:flavodoxin family protein [Solobacterium sp.]